MRLFNADFYRFFAFGFAAGAALVFLTLNNGMANDGAGLAASDIVPHAVAAPAPTPAH